MPHDTPEGAIRDFNELLALREKAKRDNCTISLYDIYKDRFITWYITPKSKICTHEDGAWAGSLTAFQKDGNYEGHASPEIFTNPNGAFLFTNYFHALAFSLHLNRKGRIKAE